MQKVLEFVRRRALQQQDNPFIRWVTNPEIPAAERLSRWMPCCALFAFGFRDVNSLVLRYPEEQARLDPLKQAINRHTGEDSTHWPWYLSDVKKLGLDQQLSFTDALKLLWGNETKTQRLATYAICKLAARAEDPRLRYCLIETIEIFGHFLFGRLNDVSRCFFEQTGIELSYLGPTHFERETGRLANQSDTTEEDLWNTELDETTRAQAMSIVTEMSDLVEARWVEFYDFATRERSGALEPVRRARAAPEPTRIDDGDRNWGVEPAK